MNRINSLKKHELRKSLCNAFDGKCAYCRRQIGMKGTVDHYMPQALGGTNERKNLRWCCSECNGQKADMHPQEWETWPKRIRVQPQTKAERRAVLLASIAPVRQKTKEGVGQHGET